MIFVDADKSKQLTGIYQIKNIVNGFAYVGQTRESFWRRYLFHRWKLKKHIHDNVNLQKDLDIFGEDSFEFSVLEVSVDNLDELEKKWIAYQRSNGKCYNIQDGGKVTLVNYVTKEGHKITGAKNREHMLGKRLSEDTKRKMSESRKGKTIKKKTDKLTPDDAHRIKTMLVEGYSTGEICDVLDIPYRLVNNILSNDAWKNVYVDGWDDFQNSRIRKRGHPVSGRYKH